MTQTSYITCRALKVIQNYKRNSKTSLKNYVLRKCTYKLAG